MGGDTGCGIVYGVDYVTCYPSRLGFGRRHNLTVIDHLMSPTVISDEPMEKSFRALRAQKMEVGYSLPYPSPRVRQGSRFLGREDGRRDSISDKTKDVKLENTKGSVRCFLISGMSLASFPAKFEWCLTWRSQEGRRNEATNHFAETSHETTQLDKGRYTF